MLAAHMRLKAGPILQPYRMTLNQKKFLGFFNCAMAAINIKLAIHIT
jgi:hypothetical protein